MKKLHIFALLFFLSFLPTLSFAESPLPGGFSAAVSPPRYELAGQPGQVLRNVLTIYNLGKAPEQYQIRSSEWTMDADNRMSFADELAENSCRPWLRLERHLVTVMPGQPRRFRWEIHIPEDAQPRECTFALFTEGVGEGVVTEVAKGIKLPVQGRIAAIVYLAIGDVKPDLKVKGYRLIKRNNKPLPAIIVENSGKAHGRLSGSLTGKDAKGEEFDISVSTMPVLAGQTKALILNPNKPDQETSAPVEVQFPLRIKGTIFWQQGKFSVDTIIKQDNK